MCVWWLLSILTKSDKLQRHRTSITATMRDNGFKIYNTFRIVCPHFIVSVLQYIQCTASLVKRKWESVNNTGMYVYVM